MTSVDIVSQLKADKQLQWRTYTLLLAHFFSNFQGFFIEHLLFGIPLIADNSKLDTIQQLRNNVKAVGFFFAGGLLLFKRFNHQPLIFTCFVAGLGSLTALPFLDNDFRFDCLVLTSDAFFNTVLQTCCLLWTLHLWGSQCAPILMLMLTFQQVCVIAVDELTPLLHTNWTGRYWFSYLFAALFAAILAPFVIWNLGHCQNPAHESIQESTDNLPTNSSARRATSTSMFKHQPWIKFSIHLLDGSFFVVQECLQFILINLLRWLLPPLLSELLQWKISYTYLLCMGIMFTLQMIHMLPVCVVPARHMLIISCAFILSGSVYWKSGGGIFDESPATVGLVTIFLCACGATSLQPTLITLLHQNGRLSMVKFFVLLAISHVMTCSLFLYESIAAGDQPMQAYTTLLVCCSFLLSLFMAPMLALSRK